MTTSTIGGAQHAAPRSRPRRVARYALTALRILLAVEFAGAGLMKLAGVEAMVELFADIGVGQWFRYVVGLLELAGAVGLLVPRLTGAAALGLSGLMVGALVTNVLVLGGVPVLEVLFLTGTATVAYARRAQLRSLAGRIPIRRG
jgi:putative oxidoreductase